MENELVLITGGSSGLGYSIACLLATHGTQIAVLDVLSPPDSLLQLGGPSTLRFYECDVASANDLATTHARIKGDFGRTPSIVISNAGVMRSGTILQSEMHDIDAVLNINLRAQFLLARQFVHDIQASVARGHWITIASSLGYVGAHSLGAYCASKSGAIAFHETLTTETAGTGLTTTLVCPGQLDTRMFAALQTPNAVLAPVVDTLELAKRVVRVVVRRQAGDVAEPLYARFIPIMRALPSGLQILLRKFAGLDSAAQRLVESENEVQ